MPRLRPALLAFCFLFAPSAARAQATPAQMKVQVGSKVYLLDTFGVPKGRADAPVWIVEMADFGCGYCAKFAAETMPVLDSLYTKTGRVRWAFVPFVLGMFPNAREAAEGSICAAEQGKFWPMHDRLYRDRKAWQASRAPQALVARLASESGLDMARYGQCIKGKAVTATLARNNALAQALQVRGTPTFVINGEIVPGALPTEVFVKGLDAVYQAVTKAPAPTR